MTTKTSTVNSPLTPAKKRLPLLDGLRGVAAIMVILFHVGEGFATNVADQAVNHGFLAVDFFFLLSGYVVGYAYDSRWQKMTTGNFFRRRLIRLHPMVILGAILGTITFILQGQVQWDGTPIATSSVILALFFGLFLLPALPGSAADVRGHNEIFALNGPTWSLFFEYIGNILYAIALRKTTTKQLTIITLTAGLLLAVGAITDFWNNGNLGVGWSMTDYNFFGGFLRMMFSFSLGLLLMRKARLRRVKGAFWICATLLAVVLATPYIGSLTNPIYNAIYELICIMLLFPTIVCIAAGSTTSGHRSGTVCNFLGEISYPLYAIHYPTMYLFYSWVWGNSLTFGQAWPVAIAVVVGNIILAYIALRYYDRPIRRLLSNR